MTVSRGRSFAGYTSLILVAVSASTVNAEPVHFGFIGGVTLTEAVGGDFGGSPEGGRYTIGLMFELLLRESIAFEANALYKRIGYSASQSDSGITITGQVRANSWEFPLLVKYYLPLAPTARPFVGGGYVIRHLTGANGSGRISGTTSGRTPIDAAISVPASEIVRMDPTHGAAVETGLRFGIGRFNLVPRVRYTRWGSKPFDESGPRGFAVQSSQNQVEILVGFTF